MQCTPRAGLLAPIYSGLSLGLLALALKFFQEVFHVIPNVFALTESDLILVILSLIDMALVGGLLVMVMISGYENFVSQLDIDEHKEKLSWLGTMDSTSLKMKVAASIVAISSIHLLRVFHGCTQYRDRVPDVVRDHSHDLCGLGVCHGLPGQIHQTLRAARRLRTNPGCEGFGGCGSLLALFWFGVFASRG
jgi:uncharacterized protein (TIGR00645 family)